MSINSELERLDAVRDALVVSVNSKGGELPEDATLWQVKAGIDNITISGGGGECDHPEANIGELHLRTTTGRTVEADITIGKGLVTSTQTITKTEKIKRGGLSGIDMFRNGDSVYATYAVGSSGWIDKEDYSNPISETYTIPAAEITPPVLGCIQIHPPKEGDTMARITATLECTSDGYVYKNKVFTDELWIHIEEGRTITPGTKKQIALAPTSYTAVYINGNIEVEGDANLVAENIRHGVSIFGVTGSFGETVTQPAPHINWGDDENGRYIISAYEPVQGYTEDTEAKVTKEYVETLPKTTVTPGIRDQNFGNAYVVMENFLTVKGDTKLVAENIKKGVSIFGVEGSYEGVTSATAVVPGTCIAYLGSNGTLYVRRGSGITVNGLELTTSDREGWDAYSGFTAGTIPGSVLSQDGVYLQWEGFKDLNQKWSVHSLMNSGYRESSEVYRIGWGFDRVDDQGGDYDSELGYGTDTSGFRCMAYVRKRQLDTTGPSSNWYFPDDRASREVSPVHCVSYGLSWDGNGKTADSKLYYYGDHYLPTHSSGHQKLFEPPYYDEMMGGYMGNAYSYSLGDKLYLGKPEKCDVGDAQSGVMILGFALELASYGSGDYYSPFFTGAYKNL